MLFWVPPALFNISTYLISRSDYARTIIPNQKFGTLAIVSGIAEIFFLILILCAKTKRFDKLLSYNLFFHFSPCQGPLHQ